MLISLTNVINVSIVKSLLERIIYVGVVQIIILASA
jgi:hypothetical protein